MVFCAQRALDARRAARKATAEANALAATRRRLMAHGVPAPVANAAAGAADGHATPAPAAPGRVASMRGFGSHLNRASKSTPLPKGPPTFHVSGPGEVLQRRSKSNAVGMVAEGDESDEGKREMTSRQRTEALKAMALELAARARTHPRSSLCKLRCAAQGSCARHSPAAPGSRSWPPRAALALVVFPV